MEDRGWRALALLLVATAFGGFVWYLVTPGDPVSAPISRFAGSTQTTLLIEFTRGPGQSVESVTALEGTEEVTIEVLLSPLPQGGGADAIGVTDSRLVTIGAPLAGREVRDVRGRLVPEAAAGQIPAPSG